MADQHKTGYSNLSPTYPDNVTATSRNGKDSLKLAEASDTNPLTKSKHMYYIHPRLARHKPQGQGGTTTQWEAHPRPPRTQRPSPSQRAAHTPPHGSSESRHLLIPKAPAHPSPTTQAMEDALVRYVPASLL